MTVHHPTPKDIENIVSNVQLMRYFTGVGYVMLIYDHILTFDREVEYIWKAKRSILKAIFLFLRYVVPSAMTLQILLLSDIPHFHLSDSFCRIHFSISMFLGTSTIAIGNFVILLRLWVLWERDRRLVFGTLFFFLITVLATYSLSVRALVLLLPSTGYSKSFAICLSGSSSMAWGPVWIPSILFEVMIFVLTCWNAFDRPRAGNSALTKALYHDGFVYFMLLFTLRITNFVLAVAAPLSLTYLCVFFVWCTTTLTLMRFLLNLRELSAYESEGALVLRTPSRERVDFFEVQTPASDIELRSHELNSYWSN